MKAPVLYSPMMGVGIGGSKSINAEAILAIEDFFFSRLSNTELTTNLLVGIDNNSVWDLADEGANFTPTETPVSEGFWFTEFNNVLSNANFASVATWGAQDGNISYTVSNNEATVKMIGGSRYIKQAFTTSPGTSYRIDVAATAGQNSASCNVVVRDGDDGLTNISTSSSVADGVITHYFTAISTQSTIRLNTVTTGASLSSDTFAISTWKNVIVAENNINPFII
tara:strand:- start:41 stop:715 length:675 start_codon:yes stop_codon:yes gene_type:complete